MTDALERLTTALADRYRIEHEIGRGGMATVYLAEDLKHHRKVAVEVLQPAPAAVLGAEPTGSFAKPKIKPEGKPVLVCHPCERSQYGYVHSQYGNVFD